MLVKCLHMERNSTESSGEVASHEITSNPHLRLKLFLFDLEIVRNAPPLLWEIGMKTAGG